MRDNCMIIAEYEKGGNLREFISKLKSLDLRVNTYDDKSPRTHVLKKENTKIVYIAPKNGLGREIISGYIDKYLRRKI